jgi:hypothetical protein
MQRFVSGIAFVLGFVGVMALAAGGSFPSVSGQGANNGAGPNWISLPSNPSHTSFGTLGTDGNYRGVISPDLDVTPDVVSPAGPASHTSFGTLMSDGTYCGVCVPYMDGTD